MTNYLEVTNLSKSFDSFQLHNISFTLPKGYIMGLIGPNGSGKTTTIKLILNMLKRTGGTVKVMGLDNIAEEQKVKSELGVVFDTHYFSDDILSKLGQPEICGYVTEISHCTNQKGKRTFQRYADEVNACLCVFIRRQTADPRRADQWT